ncbi:urease accessory protein UreD [Mycobacterium sp. NAZ190054]|uniref:urease accessory protein UreD n=1 Tax=Mycobacterium sp. NAZ190054 TaxID=1747766 RepID=UPI0007935B33|nr:urease accessory protein UreD [Mycobacterium sp. NAZ190054]KWX57269.1 urease accessory protein ureD [Mycobacterium sp. NAZ190054]
MTATAIRPGELGVEVVADAAGRTRTTRLRQRYPQRVTAPLHCDPRRPGAATLCVQSPSGGTFSDDELHTTVRCRPGSELHLTTQAATQVFAGDGMGARHRLDFTVDAGAVLEYCPGTVIPHRDSRFHQRLDVGIATGGVYLGWEAVAAGRIAHCERFGYTCYDNAFVVRVDGRPVARDRQVIRPGGGDPGPLVDSDYLGTFLAVAPGCDTVALLDRLRLVLDGTGGAGRLPHGAGVFARVAVPGAPELRRIRRRLFDAARHELSSRAGGK